MIDRLLAVGADERALEPLGRLARGPCRVGGAMSCWSTVRPGRDAVRP